MPSRDIPCSTHMQSARSSRMLVSVNLTLERYAQRQIIWAETGAVRNTKKIPNNNLVLKCCSSIMKKRKVPNKINRTPRVALFDDAWARVYKSGKRINPMALIKLKIAPIRIITTVSPLIRFPINCITPFDKSGKSYRTDERKNSNQ